MFLTTSDKYLAIYKTKNYKLWWLYHNQLVTKFGKKPSHVKAINLTLPPPLWQMFTLCLESKKKCFNCFSGLFFVGFDLMSALRAPFW